MGVYCIVFNGNESIESTMVIRLLSAATSMGSWICFDEINRVDTTVLAIFGDVMNDILNALRG